MEAAAGRPRRRSGDMQLLISKHPQFTTSGEVVLGQCEPYTSGWRLRLLDGDKEKEEVLLTGTYYDLRRAQQAMAGKSPEEMRQIAAEIKREMETAAPAATDSGPPVDPDSITSVMTPQTVARGMEEQAELAHLVQEMDGGLGPGGSFLKLNADDGVLTARLAQERFLNEPEKTGGDLEKLLVGTPQGVVLDLKEIHVLSTGSIRELVRFADEANQRGSAIALAEMAAGVRKVMEMASLDTVLPSFPSVREAAESLKAIAGDASPESDAEPPPDD